MPTNLKTLFTVVDSESSITNLDAVIELSQRVKCHLRVLVLELAKPSVVSQYGTADAIRHAQNHARGENELNRYASKISNRVNQEDFSNEILTALVIPSEVDDLVAEHALSADLTVFVGLRPELSRLQDYAIHGALLKGSGPILLLPQPTEISRCFPHNKNVMIAWDGGSRVMRTVRDALEILKQADQVHLAVIEPSAKTLHMMGSFIASLERHGIRAVIHDAGQHNDSVSDALLRMAKETDADLMVIGGYGHSRLRERIFGGTTKHIIEHSDVPVFMSH